MTAPAWARLRGSVRVRVMLLAAGLFAVTLVAAGFLVLHTLERFLVDDLRTADRVALAREASAISSEGLPAQSEVMVASPHGVVQLAREAERPIVFIHGSTLAGEPAEGPSYSLADPATLPPGSWQVTAEVLGIDDRPDDFEVTTVSFGSFALATASPLDDVRSTVERTRQALLLFGPVLVAAVAGVAWLLAGRALRPVHAVTTRVAAIGSDSLDERVPVPPTNDEIAELATTMNHMLARIDGATIANRRLVSDASHELRTPVAVMRAELEVAGLGADGTHTHDWESTRVILLDELDRLQRLVDDLLLVARGAEVPSTTPSVSVDLVDVVIDAAARRRRADVEVEVETPSGERRAHTTVEHADAEALRRAIDHLVSNAARHAVGAVRLTVEAGDGEVVVHVDDDGPGIPAQARDAVLERFVRLDEARTRDVGGAGLGLSVVREVAAAHHGHLTLTDAPTLGGLRATLALPLSPRDLGSDDE